METALEHARNFFRIFFDPKRFAEDNIRNKTLVTFVWSSGFVFSAMILIPVDEMKVTLWDRSFTTFILMLSSLVAGSILYFANRGLNLKLVESYTLYMVWAAVLMLLFLGLGLLASKTLEMRTPNFGYIIFLEAILGLFLLVYSLPAMVSHLTGRTYFLAFVLIFTSSAIGAVVTGAIVLWLLQWII